MSRWYVTLSLVIALAGALVAFGMWQSVGRPAVSESAVESSLSSSNLPVNNVAIEGSAGHGAAGNGEDADQNADVATDGLWQVLDEIPENAPKIREDVPEKHLVKLDSNALRNLQKGMSARISIPGLREPVEVTVTSVEVLSSGNTSILGKINENPLLDFVATIGENATYATIGTEAGVYNLRGNRELAWIAPGRAFNHHVDPRIPDFVIPEKPVPTPIGE
ncbi:MAG: hypothetical protein ACE37D_00585 [Pseudomonadales bacterium]